MSESMSMDFNRKVFCMNHQPTIEVTALDRALGDFSAKIKPDETLMKQHRAYAQSIAEILKENSAYKIDRLLIAGSFGKRTNTIKSDADCVYFINDQKPPYDEIVAEFYNICNKREVKELFKDCTYKVKLNRNSLNFNINGFEMDVVLAPNLVNNLKKHQSLPHVQQRAVLEVIKSNPAENCYKYSSGLAEASVYFMKTRVGFANEMARIAKYWFKSLGRDFKHISGASTFIELVAVDAARKGRLGNRKHNPYLKAFLRFLNKLKNFKSLAVSFNRCNSMFEQHRVSDSTMPRVIDPVNPYNNFALSWCNNEDDMKDLERSAADTLAKLESLVLTPSDVEGDSAEFLFH